MIKKNSSGMIIVAVILIMAAVLLLVTYFLQYIIFDLAITKSYKLSNQTYYLSEAGIQQAVWKIKNTPSWLAGFTTDPSWTQSFSMTDSLFSGGSYTVAIKNTSIGRAEVISTSTIVLNGQTSQRVVSTKIFKAIGTEVPTSSAVFIDQNININGSNFYANNGNLFSNSSINLTSGGRIYNNQPVKAAGTINICSNCSISGVKYGSNYPPAAVTFNFPIIDFNSSSTTSYLSQANHIYTSAEFTSLFDSSDNVTLSGIVYVKGDAIIPKRKTLTLNGLLVADGNISNVFNTGNDWHNYPNLYVNHTSGQPSGLLSKQNITISNNVDNFTFSGLMYALNSITITLNDPVTINGAIFTRVLTADSPASRQNLTINFDSEVMQSVFSGNISPLIKIDHWEEEY